MPDLYSTRGRALKLVKLQNEPGLSVITQLRQALGANFGRVVDLFRDLDEDGNGSVSRSEFRSVLPMLGLQVHREDADAFFDTLDTDRSGGIDYDELHNKLRAGAEVTLDASLHPGAAGRIATVSLNTNSLRSGVLMDNISGVLGLDTQLSIDSDDSVAEQLRDALGSSMSRVVDLFREWCGA